MICQSIIILIERNIKKQYVLCLTQKYNYFCVIGTHHKLIKHNVLR